MDATKLRDTIAQARADAQTELAEMRKSWDRVAQDVFSAFVTRLVAGRAEGAPRTRP
jgi:hypothetical protein